MVPNENKLENSTIIIPLHIPLKYPCDYIDQTAKILAKKNSVIFFDYYYPYSWKNLLKFDNLKRLFYSFYEISRFKKTVYFRAPAIFPFSRLKIIISLNKKLGFLILSLFVFLLKKKVVVWQFYPLITKKMFKKRLFVYDCVDYINLQDQTKAFFYPEKKLFEISDLIVFNSKDLFKKKLGTNRILIKKSIVTVCGCNTRLFEFKTNNVPQEFVNILQKKVVFMGIFDYRTNVKLLNYVVTNNTDLSFIFIGPIQKNVEKKFFQIIKEKNVFYLGERKKAELAPYLINSDLGIIPYNSEDEFIKYSNPMKAYEYLAAGLPVVSTKIIALENYPKDIIYTTDSQEGFNQAIKRLVDGWNDKKITIAKNIAKKNSWKNKIENVKKYVIEYEKAN